MASNDRWIVIPGWSKFQHYPDNRGIVWVKDYLDQLDRDDYMDLTLAERGLLADLRKLFARRRGLVHADAKLLSRALTVRVTQKHLDSLNDAGFIQIVASKPLAQKRSKKREEKKRPALARETEPPTQPSAPPHADAEQKLEQLIRNGVIHDLVDLEAEIRGYRINGNAADRLRELL